MSTDPGAVAATKREHEESSGRLLEKRITSSDSTVFFIGGREKLAKIYVIHNENKSIQNVQKLESSFVF